MGVYVKYTIDNQTYDVNIVRKNNKNTYIRVTENMTILVTTNRFMRDSSIKKMLDQNQASIIKMLNRQSRHNEKKNSFFYLGNSYDIIEVSIMDKVELGDGVIYTPNQKSFDKWYKSELRRVFEERLKYNCNRFLEVSKCPSLKIRAMKTRWGVYNRVNHSITLNSHLLEYDYDKIDYVIIHELSHVIHFDHSPRFWNLVGKYCPDYKKIRKELKE